MVGRINLRDKTRFTISPIIQNRRFRATAREVITLLEKATGLKMGEFNEKLRIFEITRNNRNSFIHILIQDEKEEKEEKENPVYLGVYKTLDGNFTPNNTFSSKKPSLFLEEEFLNALSDKEAFDELCQTIGLT